MKIKNGLFLLSLSSILLLIFLSQTSLINGSGKISDIRYSNGKITISLEDKIEELIIFESNFLELDLSIGDKISYEGTRDTYKGKEQIIVGKIYLLRS